jgi:hypothetical protein
MPRVCNVADVPVGGQFQDWDEKTQQPTGGMRTCLDKGVQPGTGIGYSVVHRDADREIHEFHFKYRGRVYWTNDQDAPLVEGQERK